jgi:hypothetical protein
MLSHCFPSFARFDLATLAFTTVDGNPQQGLIAQPTSVASRMSRGVISNRFPHAMHLPVSLILMLDFLLLSKRPHSHV